MASCVLLLLLVVTVAHQDTSAANTYTEHLSEFLKKAKTDAIIDEDQYRALVRLAKVSTAPESVDHEVSENQGIFMTMYNQLTLLNVLYFAGSLLIMGAYTLLMTLAWSRFNRTWLTYAMLGQFSFSGIMGVLLWNTSYQFLGGL